MNKFIAKINNLIQSLSPTKFFIFTALAFGVIFIFLTPPFQTPDEPVHFYRSYQISEGNFIVDKAGDKTGGVLPKSLSDTVMLTSTNPSIQFEPGEKYSVHKTAQALSIDSSDEKIPYEFSATTQYSPVAYIPQASGILVSRLFDVPPILNLYSAKLANLIVWVVLLGGSIRLIPNKKWALVAVGLLPMAVFQGTSLSTDVMATGLGALFLSYILKIVSLKTKLEFKQFLMLILLATAMVLTKQVMFIFLPLILLIPRTQFQNLKTSIILKLSILIIPIACLAAWFYKIRNIDISSTFANGQIPEEQLRFIIENPHSFINVLWNTNFFTWGDAIASSVIGTFGWMDAPLGEALIILGYIILFLIFVSNYTQAKKWLTTKQKIIIGCVALVFWTAICAALYVYYSPVGFKIIVGLQGRYFIPLLMLLIPLFYGSWLKTSEKAYKRIAIFGPILLLVASTITIGFRYYINNV